MTTIPGHNIIIQQSGSAQKTLQQSNTAKAVPEQAVAQQQINEQVKKTIVQESDESVRLKAEAEAKRQELLKKKEKKKKRKKEGSEPDQLGRLLDTIV